jgi:hypothetical protein
MSTFSFAVLNISTLSFNSFISVSHLSLSFLEFLWFLNVYVLVFNCTWEVWGHYLLRIILILSSLSRTHLIRIWSSSVLMVP